MTPESTQYLELIDDVVHGDELIEHGKRHARASGALKAQPDDMIALKAFGASRVRETLAPEFDPAKNAQDALHDAEHTRTIAELDEAMVIEAHAHGAAVVSDRTLAESATPGEEPHVDWFLVLTAVLVMSLSFSPTIHDRLLVDFEDATTAWALAFGCGSFLGAFIVWSMTLTIAVVGRASRWLNALGLFAGLSFGLAAGVLRWSMVESVEGQLMTLGMSLMEASTIIFLEWLAIALRTKHATWTAATDVRDRLTNKRDADAEYLGRCAQATTALKGKAADHTRYVETRWVRCHLADELERAGVDAVLKGYAEGINENLGHTRGLRRIS